ncbi:MAG: hypothetical protein K2K94_09015, partial [Muribaculaceae bacterium]|nr:hypothetical protein [Muribaculaceae bacterium]
SHVDDCFVSTLAQTSTGIPFQVYCFANTSAWFAYEAIQDSIFEHLAAMLSSFQLYTFEYASGRDTVVDGYLSPGGDIDEVFGVPYPFFQNPKAPDSPASTRVIPKGDPRIDIVSAPPENTADLQAQTEINAAKSNNASQPPIQTKGSKA